MEILLVGILVLVLVVGLVGYVAIRRRGEGELEPGPGPAAEVERPAATAVAEAPPVEEVPAPTAEEIEELVEGRPEAPAEPEVEEVPPELEEAVEEALAPPKPRLRDRLAKARGALSGVFTRSRIDDEAWDDLEEALIRADVGVEPAVELVSHVKERCAADGVTEPAAALDVLKQELKERLATVDGRDLSTDAKPAIWLFVGVNGVGKTTTIGKLGKRESDEGHTVVLAAGDTFRAAAVEQLGTWAERSGATFIHGSEGADPSSVIFDAVESATAKGADLVLADTAGRLHTKVNLMEELKKVRRVAEKGEGTVTEVLLVLDATTGQNGLVQARQFTEAVQVTGVVLTKLDGSAKGGIVLAIQSELGIPVKLVGIGEGVDDLVEFDPDEFVEALFD
jgi:fused signal recognition particle receptor